MPEIAKGPEPEKSCLTSVQEASRESRTKRPRRAAARPVNPVSRRPRMDESSKPRLVGINHVAIEVGDIDAALEWYGRLFAFTLRGKGEHNAFIDMGDQFINMTLVDGPTRQDMERRHIGLVVDDRSRVIELAQAAGARMVEGPFLD